MARTRTALKVLSLVLLLGALVGGGLWLWRQAPPSVAVLPDGSRLVFLGTAVGTATFTTAPPFYRWLARLLPGPGRRWGPPFSSGSCSTSTNSITCFFHHLDDVPGQNPWVFYGAEDAAGFRFPLESGGCGFGGGGSTPTLHGYVLRAYPRRQRSFDLVFYSTSREEVARLRIPNPVRGPFPVWSAEPLPVTRTNGPVTLTLEALGWDTAQSWSPVVPHWTVAAKSSSWAQAEVGWTQVEDPTGNEGSDASPREAVWRLRATLNRERWEDFDPAERLVVTNHLQVPGLGEMIPLDAVVEVGGTRLTLGALCGPGQLSITNGTARGMSPPDSGRGSSGMSARGTNVVEYWGRPGPFWFLEVEGLAEHDRVLWRAFDGEGRELAWGTAHGGFNTVRQRGAGRVYVIEFAAPKNGVISRFEAVVSRALEFQFDVHTPASEGHP